MELNETKVPAVRIDPDLDKYNAIVLFPEKLKKANKMLETSNFAKIIAKKKVSVK